MSIGDTLAQARRQAGLTLEQVSERTRIRESIIASIEQDDFSSCRGDFYARGHIRSIASVVAADPVALIREYDEEHGTPGPMRAAQVFEPTVPVRIRESRSPRLGWVFAVVVLAAIGFGAYHLLAAHGPSPSASATSRVRHLARSRPHVIARQTPRPAAKPQAVIRLTASQNCWVQLSTSGGQSIYEGTILAGSSMTWYEKHAVSMVIGNPPGITLTVNGKAEQMSTGQVVTLSIDPLSKTPVTVS